MGKKPALIIDVAAAPSPDAPFGEEEESSLPDDQATEAAPIAVDPEETIASIRQQLDQLEATLRGLG